MLKLNNTVLSWMCLFLVLFCIAGLPACKTISPPSNNSNSNPSEDVKTFSRSVVALRLTEPPPTDGPGGMFSYQDMKPLPVEDVKAQLGISTIKQAALVLTPEKNNITIESIELDILSADGKEKLFSLQATPSSNQRTFNPIETQGSNAIGYVFNLDSQRVSDADKFFVSGNAIKVIPVFKRDKPIIATFYLVDKQSEVTKRY